MTRQEKNIILFVALVLAAGLCIRVWNNYKKPVLNEEPAIISAGAHINPNTATAQDLESLPGIGPVIAQRIVAYRDTNGDFNSCDELINVKGIGPKKLEQIKPFIEIP